MSANGSPPLLSVEIAFETDPLVRPAPEDWTDVTAAGVLVRSLTTRRGARTKTGQNVPGGASTVVDYPDRILEAGFTGSPWYPNVDLRRRIRFLLDPVPFDVSDGGGAASPPSDIVDGGGAASPPADVSDGGDAGDPTEDVGATVIWTGFISRLPTAWSLESTSTTVSAEGILALVSQAALPSSTVEAEIAELGAVAHWPLSESSGNRAADAIGVRNGLYSPSAATAPALLPWSKSAGQKFTPLAGAVPPSTMSVSSLALSGTDRSLAVMVRIPEASSTVDVPLWYSADGDNFWRVAVQDGVVVLEVADATEGIFQNTFQTVGDGREHLIVVRLDSGGTFDICIDGAPAALDLDTVTGTPDYAGIIGSLTSAVVGFDVDAQAKSGADVAEVHMASVALWDRVLDDSEVADLWESIVDAWDGDTTGARLNRILDLAGVDPDDRDIPDGTQVCGPAWLDNQTVGAYMQRIAQTEGGPIFETADGKIALRTKPSNVPDVSFVLSDDPDGDDGVPYYQPNLDYSTDRLVNVVNVSRAGSDVSQIVDDAESILRYGFAQQPLSTLHGTPSAARSAAARLMIRNKTPRLAVDAITVSSRHYAEVPFAVSLDVDVGVVGQFFARPPGGGTSIDQYLVTESITQNLQASGAWTTTFGVFEHVVLPCFAWDDPDAGWDDAVWCEEP